MLQRGRTIVGMHPYCVRAGSWGWGRHLGLAGLEQIQVCGTLLTVEEAGRLPLENEEQDSTSRQADRK